MGKCSICGKQCKFKSFNLGYCSHCSFKCSANDPKRLEKYHKTCQERYGFENVSQSEIIKKKKEDTCFKHFGVKYYSQTEESKERNRNTCQERYGVDHYSQSDECKKRKINICQEKWGVDYYLQTEEAKEKTKQYNQKHFGVDHYSQSNECKEKVKQTNIKNCGYPSYTQSPEFAKKHRKRVEYDGLTFDSSWEVEVYKFCKEHNIPCEYQPNITLEYMFQDKIHYYHPDFLINGKLYEVKGEQFFDGDKMICPYNRNEYKDGLYESKHQCMIQNKVIILRGEHIENLDKVFLS